MRDYWVMWTYIANYGGPTRVKAESPKAAAKHIYDCYSEDFKKKGVVIVFDNEPALVVSQDSNIKPSDL